MNTRRGTCRGCGATIEWVVTAANGKSMPLDMGVDPTGNVEIGDDGKAIVHVQPPLHEYEHRQSHFATCPEAASFSKSKSPQR